MEKITYRQLKDKHQKEVNAFPFGFCSSEKQFREMMNKWGLDPEKDLDKIVSLEGGTYARKSDLEDFRNLVKRHKEELAKALENKDFLFQAFRYELANREYYYSGDNEAVLGALGITLEGLTEEQRLLYIEAKKAYYKSIDREGEGA